MVKPALNIDEISVEDRLRLIGELWDSLTDNSADIPLTAAQKEELDRRLDDLEKEGPVGIPWEDVLAQIIGCSK